MTAGASKAEPTITRQPALAPSPQPRPAPTARSLPPKHAATGGQNWTPIRGQIWKPIDNRDSFNWMVKRAGKKAKLPFQVHAHMIRHATGYKLANAGKD